MLTKTEVRKLQTELHSLSLYMGDIDGILGPKSKAAIEKLIKMRVASNKAILSEADNLAKRAAYDDVIYGKVLSDEFIDGVYKIADLLKMPEDGPNLLIACMAFETGGKFTSTVKNAAGSGAVGLIQFMPATAVGLGTSTALLVKMTPVEQLAYVYKHFAPYKGKLNNLGDVYMAILWPRAVGKADSYVLWDKKTRPETYRQNAGLDIDKDGNIIRAEALVKINAAYARGLKQKRA